MFNLTDYDIKQYEANNEGAVRDALRLLEDFLRLYPFRDKPEEIDKLAPNSIYQKGNYNTFLYYIEFGLKDLGRIRVGNAFYAENARDNPDKFINLLKVVVKDDLSVSDKIDAEWEKIKWFGGDKNIAKKVVYCYYPDDLLPIFSTNHLEQFCNQLNVDYGKLSFELFSKSFQMLSVGKKFEVLQKALLSYKSSHGDLKRWSNALFAKFLYENLTPEKITPPQFKLNKPLSSIGILFEPEYEQEVVYLFSIFHRDMGFPYIIKLRNEFPDAIVMDSNRDTKKIEFEVFASSFISHGHNKSGCDYIVCWDNDLENTDGLPEIITLKSFIEE